MGGRGGGEGSGWGGRGQGGCDRRIEILGTIHKKKIRGGGSGGVRLGVWLVGGGGGGVRVDVNEELKFFVKIQKKIGGSGGLGRGKRGGRVGEVSGWM